MLSVLVIDDDLVLLHADIAEQGVDIAVPVGREVLQVEEGRGGDGDDDSLDQGV